ncbi:membrane-associating domain-containing protein [Powellomyces hirtus]|nr:membrane-associating domain-containing protein [Powellomyces hirtus]
MSEYNMHQPTGAPLPTGTSPYSIPPAGLGHGATLRQPSTLLRIAEWFFSLIVFSAAASYGTGSSPASFMVFTGVMGWLFTSGILAVYFIRPVAVYGSRVWAYAETAISGIWTLFFFAGSVALAADSCSVKCSAKGTSVAFGFFSVAAWAFSTWFAYMELKRV